MNSETKRLAIIATICFFPIAIVGWLTNQSSPAKAQILFRLSICIFLLVLSLLGAYAVIGGGKVVEALGTFY